MLKYLPNIFSFFLKLAQRLFLLFNTKGSLLQEHLDPASIKASQEEWLLQVYFAHDFVGQEFEGGFTISVLHNVVWDS